MRRTAAALGLVLCSAFAARAGEGVYITLDGGYSSWDTDDFRARLNKQGLGNDAATGLSNTSLLIDRQMPNGAMFGLRLGYNIAGHVAFEGNLTVKPYDLFADTRGGLGVAGITARWFPLQGLVRPGRQFDISLNAGMDYILSGGNGIHGPITSPTPAPGSQAAGSGKIDNTGRGFDGTAVELGFTAQLDTPQGVSIGITPRYYIIDPVRYFVNFDNRDKGGAIPLDGTGLVKMLSISLSVSFHFEPLPD
jgi:opacity protein-like surface antigen